MDTELFDAEEIVTGGDAARNIDRVGCFKNLLARGFWHIEA